MATRRTILRGIIGSFAASVYALAGGLPLLPQRQPSRGIVSGSRRVFLEHVTPPRRSATPFFPTCRVESSKQDTRARQ